MVASTESIQGVVFGSSSEARKHGKGGIWYRWLAGSQRKFPEDVASVFIVMPVNWGDPSIRKTEGVVCEWSVYEKNRCGAQWSLKGTSECPTLLPSLNWVGVWHGWLENGFLRSC